MAIFSKKNNAKRSEDQAKVILDESLEGKPLDKEPSAVESAAPESTATDSSGSPSSVTESAATDPTRSAKGDIEAARTDSDQQEELEPEPIETPPVVRTSLRHRRSHSTDAFSASRPEFGPGRARGSRHAGRGQRQRRGDRRGRGSQGGGASRTASRRSKRRSSSLRGNLGPCAARSRPIKRTSRKPSTFGNGCTWPTSTKDPSRLRCPFRHAGAPGADQAHLKLRSHSWTLCAPGPRCGRDQGRSPQGS